MAGNKFEEDETTKQVKQVIKYGMWILFGIIGLIIIFGSFYTIQSGQEGVLLTFNKAQAEGMQPGLHLKVPIVQSVIKFNVRTQAYGADASQSTMESAASADLQQVKMQLVVNYHLTEGMVPELFTKVGASYQDNVIRPTVHEATKACTAKFTAEELITKREDVGICMANALKEKLTPYNIIVEQVSITAFDFSEQFNSAIENKVTAEQNALAAKNKLEQIKMEAEQVRAAAQGAKDAKIAQAEGESTYVKLIQAQLSQSPQYVEYLKAQKWNGAFPTFYMVGGSSTPLIMSLPNFATTNETTQ